METVFNENKAGLLNETRRDTSRDLRDNAYKGQEVCLKRIDDYNWELCNLQESLEDISGEFVFGDDLDRAKQQILERYKASHPSLCRMFIGDCHGNTSFEVSEEEFLGEVSSIEELIDLLRERGPIMVNYNWSGRMTEAFPELKEMSLRQRGVRISYHYDWRGYKASYTEPEQPGEKKWKCSHHDLATIFYTLNCELASAVGVAAPSSKDGFRKQLECLDQFVPFFNRCFGKNSHRKLAAFQKLLEFWRLPQVQKYCNSWRAKKEREERYWRYEDDAKELFRRFDELKGWLDQEAQIRKPKTLINAAELTKPLAA